MSGRLSRQVAFGRRIPLRQIGRRLWLALRRRAERRLRPSLAVAGLQRADAPPLPLFAARACAARRTDAGWTFRFLGREAAMGEAVDWSGPDRSPASQLWRMNLHYMEYLEALDDEGFAELVAQWIAGNPPYAPGATGDGWNAYALSLRVVVWMQQLAARQGRLAPGFAVAAERSIAAQLAYLERHLETDIGGNHLIKNVKALIWAGAFFSGPRAKAWRRRGIALLKRELERQILADGLHYERSPSYHAQVFADLMETRHALGPDPLGGALDAGLGRMAGPLTDLAHPDGLPALFGDAGLGMAYAPAACLAAFGSRAAAQPIFAYRDAGYFGLRTDHCYLVADMGPIAPPQLPAHGHGDIGSFELSVGGARLVVDQGVFEYVAGERRRLSRTAASHNLLHIEGGDQADFFGAFRCGRMPAVEAEYEPLADGFRLRGRHDGYADLPGAPLVERTIVAEPDIILFHDRILGGGGAPASIGLLLHPKAAVEAGPGTLTVRRGAAGFALVSDLEAIIEDAVYWPDMGVELPTLRIRLRLPPAGREARWQLRLFWNEKQA